MYNVRYHIASLVGVFLALALGLVLGGLVVQRGTIDRQQGTLVDGLRREFSTLRAENSDLAAENLVLNSFSDDMSSEWVKDRLVGKNFVVVSGAGRTDGVDAAAEAIELAGGTVVSVTLVKNDLGLRDEVVRSTVSSEAYSSELLASVTASLAAEWVEPQTERPVTEALQAAEVIVVEGLEPGMAAAGLVDVAVRAGKADEAGMGLASAFLREESLAMAGESETVDSGLARAAWNRKIPAFDTLGSSVGHYTLVALFSGAKAGLYGSAEDATAAYPDVPEK
jgi:hypothetical protein